MAETKQRLVDGPVRDYLTAKEVAAYLGMSVRTLRRMISKGRFPRPFKMGHGTLRWSWREVWAYGVLREVRVRYQKDEAGQTVTIDDKRTPNSDKRRQG